MQKMIASLLVLAGFILVGYAGYEMYMTNVQQEQALQSAKELVVEEVEEVVWEEDGLEFTPEQGEVIGILTIPALDAELPIIEGTHEDELARGVGHFEGTGYPSQNRQILLSGHRDTVFRSLGELEVGDIFEVTMSYGTFQYEIEESFIVDADDTSVIDYSIDEELLTVSTCYPFSFVGNAPERYILQAKPL
ncbi:class D sortase [Evansella halocellulosilytica]|uniref:class D sortase n=1 Tax=Evansella halocellulosilytica TaxID=2011013 RepID=UPI000BB6D507|nr:class D sortase [Evansella halocellulosilytica]